MDELRMIGALLDERPSRHSVDQGRARLEQEIASPRRARRFGMPRPRLALPLVGVGAVAAATAVAVGLSSGTTPRAPDRPSGTAAPMSARTVLLAAAAKAEKEPVGRYWRSRTVTEGVVYAVGSGSGSYVVARSSEGVEWAPRSANDDYVSYRRPLGVGPATDADKAAWRQAGSPRTWQARTADDSRAITLTMSGPGRWETHRQSAAERRRLCAQAGGDRCDTEPWVERERLASQPGGLDELLFPENAKRAQAGGRPMTVDAANRLLASYEFLTRAASPKVRAAAFRLLADQPGIRLERGVRDMRGRAGIALVGRGRTIGGASGTFDVQLILDPGTYRVLGRQYVVVTEGGRFPGVRPGSVVERQAVLGSGWTNETPHLG